ncbi:MAG: hypothetical protein K9L79_00420 [Methylobacter tundripaludum]|nr:hypothetical protein [Methylobacter tundripaludum]
MITADDIIGDLESLTYRKVSEAYPERIALACSKALFDCLFLNFKGQSMYVPTRDIAALAALDEHYEVIWQEFKGRNHTELAIRHRLSLQHIYNIVNIMRRRHMRKHQDDLFPQDLAHEDNRPLTLVVLDDYLPAELQRAGVTETEAKILAGDIAMHLCQHYPGVSVRITEAMRSKRQNSNDDLFAGLPEAS